MLNYVTENKYQNSFYMNLLKSIWTYRKTYLKAVKPSLKETFVAARGRALYSLM